MTSWRSFFSRVPLARSLKKEVSEKLPPLTALLVAWLREVLTRAVSNSIVLLRGWFLSPCD